VSRFHLWLSRGSRKFDQQNNCVGIEKFPCSDLWASFRQEWWMGYLQNRKTL